MLWDVCLKDHCQIFSSMINIDKNYAEQLLRNKLTYKELEQRIKELELLQSENKLITKELLESEERFQALHNASFGGVIMHDQGVILDCNQGLSDMTGFTIEELVGMDGLKLIAADSLDLVVRNIKSGYNQRYEVEGIRKDGSAYPLAIRGKNIPYKGREVRVIEFRDISKVKLAEAEVRKREAKLSSIFRAAPAGIGVVVNRVIMEANDRLCKMVGYSREELLGESAKMLYSTDDEYEFVGREKYRQISEHGTGTVETRFRHKNGNLIDVLLSSTPLNLDDLSAGVTFTATDISGIKVIENKLRQSENKFRSMMESMNDLVYICSDDYHVEYMNPAMIRRTGHNATGELCFKAIHNFDEKCPWCVDNNKASGKYFESNTVSPKDKHSYLISHSPIVNSDGSPSTLIIFRDITELKETKDQLQQAQKMEAIGTLAGGVAHDFNNILTVIRGHAQLGMMQTTEENPLWNDLAEIEAAGDRASKLTRQLLAFSRKQAIKLEMIQINYLVNDLGKMLKRLVGEDVNLKINLDEKLSPILADPGQLEQVIINLVVNAADAVKDQPLAFGRNISILTSEVLLDSEFVMSHVDSKLGCHQILEIADNGCGIPKEVVEHIFEPFYTTKEVGKGTGLGLSTVYGIVKQNNASIYVESVPGQGTTFKIYWPSAKDDASKIIKNETFAPAPGGSEVILLVEDEKPTRNLALKILQQAGYTVIEAENGLDALEKTKDLQGSIDLVFTDIVMPLMGGKELNEKLSSIHPQMKFLFTSGYLSDRIDRDDVIFKDETFVDKPYDVLVLLSKIRQLLDSRGV